VLPRVIQAFAARGLEPSELLTVLVAPRHDLAAVDALPGKGASR